MVARLSQRGVVGVRHLLIFRQMMKIRHLVTSGNEIFQKLTVGSLFAIYRQVPFWSSQNDI